MKTTKEKIMRTALELFSKYGFDAVSVEMLSTELGVTKGALYRHYESKDAIFRDILNRVVQEDRDNAEVNSLPLEREGEYHVSSLDDLIEFTLKQFQFFTLDQFCSAFRRLVTLEQFRNAEMIHLYQDVFMNGPLQYTEKILTSLMDDGKIKKCDVKEASIEFFAPFFTMLSLSDHSGDKVVLVERLRKQYQRFKSEYMEEK